MRTALTRQRHTAYIRLADNRVLAFRLKFVFFRAFKLHRQTELHALSINIFDIRQNMRVLVGTIEKDVLLRVMREFGLDNQISIGDNAEQRARIYQSHAVYDPVEKHVRMPEQRELAPVPRSRRATTPCS